MKCAKRLLAALLAVLMLVSFVPPLSIVAADAEVDTATPKEIYKGTYSGGIEWELDTTTGVLYLSGYCDYTRLPEVSYWMSYSDYIKHIVVSIESYDVVHAHAFQQLTKLESITFESDIKVIDKWAFAQCYSLKSITLPNSLEAINHDAFNSCTSLIAITVPNLVKSIGHGAFANCSGLTAISIGVSVEEIGMRAFYKCRELKSINIPASVKSIEKDAFVGCTTLSTIILDEANTRYSLRYGHMLVDEQDGVLIADTYANNEWNVRVVLDDDIVSVVADLYAGDGNITEVFVGSGIETIGGYAFWICYALDTVYISSQTVAEALTSEDACGYLIAYAGNVNVQEGIEVPEYVSNKLRGREALVYNGITYISYSDHDHLWIDRGTKCSRCSMQRDPNPYELGDANGDGSVDSLDAACILKYDVDEITLDAFQLSVADVNNGRKVNSLDAAKILKYDAGMIDGL